MYSKISKDHLELLRSNMFLVQRKQLFLSCGQVWGKMKNNSENFYLEEFVKLWHSCVFEILKLFLKQIVVTNFNNYSLWYLYKLDNGILYKST